MTEEILAEKEGDLIILNFWATYCSPCKKEMPDFIRIYKEYREKNIAVIGVTFEPSSGLSLIRKLTGVMEVNYPIVFGASNLFLGEMVNALPTTYILNRDGKVLEKIIGSTNYFDLKVKIDRELSKLSVNSYEGDNFFDKKASSLYHIQLFVENETLFLEIVPTMGYRIGGEEYLPMEVTFYYPETIHNKKNFLPFQEGSYRIVVEDDFFMKIPELRGHIKMTLCSDNACILVDEDFSVALRGER